jgi:hypothetical protein
MPRQLDTELNCSFAFLGIWLNTLLNTRTNIMTRDDNTYLNIRLVFPDIKASTRWFLYPEHMIMGKKILPVWIERYELVLHIPVGKIYPHRYTTKII